MVMDFSGPDSFLKRASYLVQNATETESVLASTNNAVRIPNPGKAVLDLYLFFNIFPSHFALPLLVITLVLAQARRNVTLTNMCLTWMIVGFVSCILLYAGKQTGPEPPPLLCMTQASLLYAVPPMVSASVLALVFQLWRGLVWRPGEKTRAIILAALLLLPYIVFFAFAVVGSMIATRKPKIVSRTRRFFYCSIHSPMFSGFVSIWAAVTLIITAGLQISIAVTLYRHRQAIKQRRSQQEKPDKGFGADDLQFALRVFIFAAYIIVCLVLSLLSIVAPRSAVPDMIFASVGTGVVLVFGTQPALLRVWVDVFRRFHRAPAASTVAPFTASDASQVQSVSSGKRAMIESNVDAA